ncbi:MAG: hypothetical protein CVV24_06055 [Ignavibacteriae bacterium HGW-Ignavibacteriae-3]|nr:MAG: hypothetical protein CVV24_06055 [Ignavibacteriae bacterium HGW-Ignavibacteriae-3]
MKKILLFLLIPFIISSAQISISAGGGNIIENFNGMGTSATATLPVNWRVDKNTTVRTLGNYSSALNSTERRGGINENSSMANGIYNFGLGDAASATDRAVGGQSSSTSSKSVNLYAYFKNVGTSTISQLDLSYDIMRFRNGSNPVGFSVQLYYSNDGATWTSAGQSFLSSFSPNADNNGASIVPMEAKNILNQTLNGLTIPQNGSLYLAWNYSVTSGSTTSNAQALGIDNFVMNNIGGSSTAPAAAAAVAATSITQTGFMANWNSSSGATGYFLDVSTSSSFSSYLSGYENKNVGNVLNFNVTNLNINTTYYYRVRASNSFGTSVNSNTISVSTLAQITFVQFKGISDAVIKSAGTYTIDLSITDPSITTATTCAVTFIADSSTATASYLNDFSTQTVTFPAGSSANQQVVFTIKDNGVVEPAKKAFLQIQNVSGGSAALAGTISKFKLSITSGVNNAYYAGIPSGLAGAALKTALYNLIKGHTKYPYTDSNPTKTDVWKMLRAADEDPKNPDNVIGIYSGLSIGKDPQTYWNREHVWSKSHGPFSETVPGAGTDGHHLRPENPTVNSTKSNLDFDNGGILVPNGGGSKYIVGTSWEARDEVKGDIARMIFYMATRYQGESGEPNLQVVDYIPSSPNNQPLYGKLSTLLAWNHQDPPDAFEMNRNNTIAFYQGNRNPYIDHPEWVSSVFGSATTFTVGTSSNPSIGGSTSGGGTFNSGASVTLTATPNPGYTFTSWTEGGILVSTSSSYNFTISTNRSLVANFTAIPPTQYSVTLSSIPAIGGTTSGGGTFNSGASVTVTATPNSGYTFTNWTEGGTQVSTSSSYNFSISGNRTLVANFAAIPPTQFSVSLSSIPAAGGITGGGGTFNSGASVTVTATPNSGYTFTNWTEGGTQVSISSSYNFSISGNRTLAANFSLIPSLSVAPDFEAVTSSGGTKFFTVTNSTGGTMNWIASSTDNWITITNGNSGINNGIINFSYLSNNGNARVGTITVTAAGALASPKTVEVRQALATTVEPFGSVIPTKYGLNQNFPNPFNPSTVITFSIPKESFVTLKIFNLLGKEEKTLVNQFKPTGIYSVSFDASNLNSGIYFYQLQADNYFQVRKMLLLK